MKKLWKYLGLVALFLIILFIIVINFSGKESKFECSGEITQEATRKPTKVYLKLTEYRFWVGLWSKSKGCLSLEIPNRTFAYYEQIDRVGDNLHIYSNNDAKGLFSRLSNALTLDIGAFGVFEGTCNLIQ